MSAEPAHGKRSRKWWARKGQDASKPKTVEIEINGRKVQAQTRTVQTGAGSLPRFLRRLFS